MKSHTQQGLCLLVCPEHGLHHGSLVSERQLLLDQQHADVGADPADLALRHVLEQRGLALPVGAQETISVADTKGHTTSKHHLQSPIFYHIR